MEIMSVENYETMSEKAASLIIGIMKKNNGGLFCFAGGDTPIGTLKKLVEHHENGDIDLNKYHYIQLDEWVGLGEADKGSCSYYLNKFLFSPANINEKNTHKFDATSNDLQEECQLADNYIKKHGGITLSLLGVGVNGHLGFNEPGVSFEESSHTVNLKKSTTEVGQKYFDNYQQIDKGITLGLKELFYSKNLVLLANGNSKKEAIKQLIQSDSPDINWPVTIIKQHPQSYAIIEKTLLNF